MYEFQQIVQASVRQEETHLPKVVTPDVKEHSIGRRVVQSGSEESRPQHVRSLAAALDDRRA